MATGNKLQATEEMTSKGERSRVRTLLLLREERKLKKLLNYKPIAETLFWNRSPMLPNFQKKFTLWLKLMCIILLIDTATKIIP